MPIICKYLSLAKFARKKLTPKRIIPMDHKHRNLHQFGKLREAESINVGCINFLNLFHGSSTQNQEANWQAKVGMRRKEVIPTLRSFTFGRVTLGDVWMHREVRK